VDLWGYHKQQLEIAHHQIGASSSAISISLSANKSRVRESTDEAIGDIQTGEAIGASVGFMGGSVG